MPRSVWRALLALPLALAVSPAAPQDVLTVATFNCEFLTRPKVHMKFWTSRGTSSLSGTRRVGGRGKWTSPPRRGHPRVAPRPTWLSADEGPRPCVAGVGHAQRTGGQLAVQDGYQACRHAESAPSRLASRILLTTGPGRGAAAYHQCARWTHDVAHHAEVCVAHPPGRDEGSHHYDGDQRTRATAAERFGSARGPVGGPSARRRCKRLCFKELGSVMRDLGSRGAIRGGSSPPSRTTAVRS